MASTSAFPRGSELLQSASAFEDEIGNLESSAALAAALKRLNEAYATIEKQKEEISSLGEKISQHTSASPTSTSSRIQERKLENELFSIQSELTSKQIKVEQLRLAQQYTRLQQENATLKGNIAQLQREAQKPQVQLAQEETVATTSVANLDVAVGSDKEVSLADRSSTDSDSDDGSNASAPSPGEMGKEDTSKQVTRATQFIERTGMKQHALARRVGCSQGTLSSWLKHKYQGDVLKITARVSSALDSLEKLPLDVVKNADTIPVECNLVVRRKNFSREQTDILEQVARNTPNPSTHVVQKLSQAFDRQPRHIVKWFSNWRSRKLPKGGAAACPQTAPHNRLMQQQSKDDVLNAPHVPSDPAAYLRHTQTVGEALQISSFRSRLSEALVADLFASKQQTANQPQQNMTTNPPSCTVPQFVPQTHQAPQNNLGVWFGQSQMNTQSVPFSQSLALPSQLFPPNIPSSLPNVPLTMKSVPGGVAAPPQPTFPQPSQQRTHLISENDPIFWLVSGARPPQTDSC